ncbi:hypothetical protein HW555_007953 [Spodoptera exigua]|uniref:Uncharacterized protein n=1 Tax=Spodoptera exigua TaxID=7107 RepID=A0A835L364_SPOEX|nr:hypothetical protein HW555_007953 [Spodoptera exigua]
MRAKWSVRRAKATDADKAATEQVVDLPRISPGRGGDLCGPHAPAARATARSATNQCCAGHAPHPSLAEKLCNKAVEKLPHVSCKLSCNLT